MLLNVLVDIVQAQSFIIPHCITCAIPFVSREKINIHWCQLGEVQCLSEHFCCVLQSPRSPNLENVLRHVTSMPVALACKSVFFAAVSDRTPVSFQTPNTCRCLRRLCFVLLFLPFPLFTSSLRCVCVAHSLSCWLKLSSQWKSTHWVQGFVTSCFCLVFDSSTVVAEHGSGTESGGVTAT